MDKRQPTPEELTEIRSRGWDGCTFIVDVPNWTDREFTKEFIETARRLRKLGLITESELNEFEREMK